MIEGKSPWVYIGRSNERPIYFNTSTGEIAVEELQDGRLIDPAGPVVLDEEPAIEE